MRKLIVHEFITLDGVIQAPGGKEEDTEGGFTDGGWTREYWDNAIGERFGEIMQGADAFLLGRKTWEIHGNAFESMKPGDPFGDMMNNPKKYVVSRTLKSADLWRNSEIIQGDVVEEVKKLKNSEGRNILLDGSSQLVHTLIEHDLIDEFQLHIYPLALGNGKKLFPDHKKVEVKLIESKTLPTGVIFTHYSLDKK
jgi:dihydrofolate reductase